MLSESCGLLGRLPALENSAPIGLADEINRESTACCQAVAALRPHLREVDPPGSLRAF